MAGLVPFNKRNTSLVGNGFVDFYNMLDDFFNDSWTGRRNVTQSTFKIDVQDNEKEYVLEAELPGAKKEEINVELNDGRLSISVNREENVDEQKKNYIHKERRYSSMCRSIYLADAKSDGVKAKLNNGVLSIIVPKQDEVENIRKIEVE